MHGQFKNPKQKRLIFCVFCIVVCLLIAGCKTRSDSSFSTLGGVEEPYLRGEFAKAYANMVPQLERAQPQDKLLLLLQAGSILHTMKDWEASTRVFEEALALSDVATKSVSEEVRAFFLNDATKRYVPENFERVLIHYYLAFNYIMLGDRLRAYQYFKRMNDELRVIRDFDKSYKENYAVRYLYGLVAEALGRREEARVQYNNLIRTSGDKRIQAVGKASLYFLALTEGAQKDVERYKGHEELLYLYKTESSDVVEVYNGTIDARIDSANTTDVLVDMSGPFNEVYSELGSLVVVHENGLAPHKVSRGKIGKDFVFKRELKSDIPVVLYTDNFKALSYGQLFFWITASENPIPVFKQRKLYTDTKAFSLCINDHSVFGPTLTDSYSEVVLQNFNDNYDNYVNRHIVSIITKVATVAVSAAAISAGVNDSSRTTFSGLGDILGLLVNTIGGAVIKDTLKPDLRSWTLAFDNLQIYRIFLSPGTYKVSFKSDKDKRAVLTSVFSLSLEELELKAGETVFIQATSF